MLLKANHEESDKFISKGQLVDLKRGQFVTSISEMMEAFGWSQGKVYRFLRMLESEEMITRNGQPNGTTITVVNYGFYQDQRKANGYTNGQPDGQPNGQPDGQLSTMNNNDNNGNKGGGHRRQSLRKAQEEDDAMMEAWIAKKEKEEAERNGHA